MYVVDGYNLLHVLKKRRLLPRDFSAARTRLLELLARVARRESRPVIVFFDGRPGLVADHEFARPGVRVRFCGAGKESADRAVRDFVDQSAEPHKLTVVSSDREIRDHCKVEGAKTLGSDDFAEKLKSLAAAEPSAQPARAPEKPRRGMIGRIEREMIDDIGDLEDFERRVLDEP